MRNRELGRRSDLVRRLAAIEGRQVGRGTPVPRARSPATPAFAVELDYGQPNCIAFGGLRVDDAVEAALLAVVQPAAAQAALAAEAQAMVRRDEAREAMTRDLEAARYAADRAFRQYDAADPLNRFVAGELETRGTAR